MQYLSINAQSVSQEDHVFVVVHIEDLQLLVVHEAVQDIILGELPAIPLSIGLLQLFDDLVLAHLLLALLRHAVSYIVDDGGQFVSKVDTSEPIVLLISSVVRFLFVLVDLFQGLEAVVHQLNGLVNVGLGHDISEVEFGHGLGYSYDGKQGTWGDVHVTYLFFAFSLELSLLDISCNYVLMKVVRDSW